MGRTSMTTQFVARHQQVEQIAAALARAAEGRPGAVLLGADAGVGKTRLLQRSAELAQRAGATVVTVHCVDLGEIGLPYLPFAEALSQLRALQPEAVGGALTSRPALGRLLSAGAHELPAGEDQTSRLQLFDGLTEVLGAVGRAGAPLLLVIEDLHWADPSSRDVLRFLLARLRQEHLLVVASYRADDLHRRHPLRPMLAELTRHPRVERIDLPAFTVDELREFATATLGRALPEAELRRVSERSEGNAFFAEELLETTAADDDSLPWTLRDVLRSRLEQQDPAVQRLAQVASVAGRRVDEPLLRAVAQEAAGAELDAAHGFDAVLREAVAHHVLQGEDQRIAFRHALLAEAVYADLLPGDQVALHRAYLRAMEADPTLGLPSQVAVHAMRAHDLPTALRASHAAARAAAQVLAHVEELRQRETVLELWDAVPGAAALVGADLVDVLLAASRAASRCGELERAIALAARAVEAATGDVTRQAQVRTLLARRLLADDRVRDAHTEAGLALAALAEAPSPEALPWALATHARAAMNLDLDEEAERSAESAVASARAVGNAGAEADALTTLAVLVVDDPERAAALLTESAARARQAGDLATELRTLHNLATTHYYAGQLAQSHAIATQATAQARDAGLALSVGGVTVWAFSEIVRYALGDLSPAPQDHPPAPASMAPLFAAIELYSAVARGDADVIERGQAMRSSWDRDGQLALIAGGCTIEALAWAGRGDEAVDLALELIDHLGRTWSDNFLGGIRLAALALGALADGAERDRHAGADPAARLALGSELIERARAAAERGRPRGGRLGPEGKAWLARAEAERARLDGAADPARWQAATEAFAYGHHYDGACTRARWAEALLASGDRLGASREAARALLDAQQMGAEPLRAWVAALARRGRLDVPGVRAPAVDLLTAREAEVLALVADGLSNRQIGERLFISGKTVSVHVSNLLAKLGASGRAEAVDVAHRRGLIGARVEG
ncbi:AAA family ATPase [Cellulomonas cellasea]|uniref:helix-turn-helix transcriptional regulator n=1 Tax=Cellulomonas cellasea TaxID=43670 RepID=UPI0025A3A4B7|nr:helix-turn-helix transcriptional regulator [Cellulomonas cellasea]MDM8086300.1 AAA family ATPase [Cellulomonas cellasea]